MRFARFGIKSLFLKFFRIWMISMYYILFWQIGTTRAESWVSVQSLGISFFTIPSWPSLVRQERRGKDNAFDFSLIIWSFPPPLSMLFLPPPGLEPIPLIHPYFSLLGAEIPPIEIISRSSFEFRVEYTEFEPWSSFSLSFQRFPEEIYGKFYEIKIDFTAFNIEQTRFQI